jgi:hypothetical protein
MKDGQRTNILGLLIMLLALVLVAVGVIGLLSRNDQTTITVPVSAKNTTDSNEVSASGNQPAAVAPPADASAATVQSAVVRGGSRNQPTTSAAPAAPNTGTATGEVMLPGETLPSNNGGLVNVPSTSAFRIEVLSTHYDVSGKPSQGCSAFDNRIPIRRFTVQLAVVNDSGINYQPGEWGAAAYSGAARMTLCLSGSSGLPAFATGTRQQVTFVAFANPDQVITSINISTFNGLSARVCFDEEHLVACPA